MLDKVKLKRAAESWIDSWNSRDMENVMSHYADDVMFYSPAVIKRWAIEEGKLAGKKALEKHFRKGLEEMPGLHFEFHSILYGINNVILFYKRETGGFAADFVTFNDSGKVKEVRTCYQEIE